MSMRKKQARITVAGLALVVLLPVLVAMANGQDDSSAGDGWSRDVQTYVSEYDVTADEAAKRLRLQDEVGQLDSKLIARESATFGGLWIEHTPTFKVRVAFTEDGAETLATYEQSSDLQAVVETVVADSSLVDLGSARELAQAAVSRTGNRADFALNVPGNVVHVYTLDADRLKEDLAEARETLSTKVVIKEVSQLVSPTHGLNIHGGESLTTCTSGFSVVHTGGDKGILTAAHCDRDQARGSTDLNWENGRYGSHYDVQWHTVKNNPHVSVRNLMYDGTSERNILSGRSSSGHPVGAYVCGYGKSSGYGCGNIVENDYGWTADDGTVFDDTWVRVRNSDGDDLGQAGDSGGPWFIGSQAYGIHHGELNNTDAVYMPIHYISILNVELLTTSN